MAEAESSTDKRMFRGGGWGGVFEEETFGATNLQPRLLFILKLLLVSFHLVFWLVCCFRSLKTDKIPPHVPQIVEIVQSNVSVPSPFLAHTCSTKTQTHPAFGFLSLLLLLPLVSPSVSLSSSLLSNSSCTRLGADRLLIAPVVWSPWLPHCRPRRWGAIFEICSVMSDRRHYAFILPLSFLLIHGFNPPAQKTVRIFIHLRRFEKCILLFLWIVMKMCIRITSGFVKSFFFFFTCVRLKPDDCNL